MASFGKHVRKLRKKQGKGLRELAKEVGVTHAYLSQIENDRLAKAPSVKVMMGLAGVLGVNPDVLLAMVGQIRPSLREVICKRPRRFAALIEQLEGASDEDLDKVVRTARKVRDGDW